MGSSLMKNLLLICSMTLIFSSTLSLAQTISIPSYDIPNSAEGILRPTRGMSMNTVSTQFGQAEYESEAVGKPPITKWIYPEFVVYFEYSHVIHSVIPHN